MIFELGQESHILVGQQGVKRKAKIPFPQGPGMNIPYGLVAH